MKLKRSFVALFLSVIFAFAVIACGTTTEAPTTTGAATTTEAPTTTGAATTTEQVITTAAAYDFTAALAALSAEYADTLESDTFVATADLTLVSTISGVAVTWSSGNTTYLEDDGTVHQPSFTLGDQTVVLTATLTMGEESDTYSFFVTIGKLAKTDQERADEVFIVAAAFPVKDYWTSVDELVLPTTGTDDDDVSYPITWTSSNTDVIDTDGTIVQPLEEAADVTLTATITINGVDYSKSVDFTVAVLQQGTEVSSIAAAKTLYFEGNTEEYYAYTVYVKLLGVTVVGISSAGVYVTDGTDVLYVYGLGSDKVTVGSVYDMQGQFQLFYSAWELAGSSTEPLVVTASTDAASSVSGIQADSILDIIGDMVTPSYQNPFSNTKYTVTARVYYDSSWGDYSVFLVPADYDFNAALSTPTQPNGDSIMMYYPGDDEVLRAFHGELVTIDIYMQGYRTDKLVWYAIFFGTASDVQLAFENDQDAVDTAANAITFPNQVIEGTTFDLITSLYGATISYTSTNDAVINPTTGVVDLTTITEQTTITVTASITKNEATATKTFDIAVGPLPTTDISTVYDAPAGDLVKIQGVLTASTKAYQYFMQDMTAGIALNTYDLQTEFAAIAFGSEVIITGEVSISNGLYQLKVLDYEVTATPPAMPTPADITSVEFSNEALMPYQGQAVAFTGFVLKATPEEVNDYGTYEFYLKNYVTGDEILVMLDNRASGYTDALAELLALEVGDEVVITGAIMGWYNGPELLLTDASQMEVGTNGLTDELRVELDLANLPETLVLDGNYDIPTGDAGSTYTVVSIGGNAFNYIDATTPLLLTVTSPVGADVTGTITVQATYGEVSDTATINVVILKGTTLPIVSELFITEYGEGSSNNKWIEIFNGTGAAVDLSDYSIALYSNGSTSVSSSYQLSGTIANGDVYILTTTDATNAVILAEADVALAYPSPIHFNGDDCFVLMKDGEIIDIILSVGHTKDDKVAADLTWVRKDTVTAPNTTFTLAEWDAFGIDYTDSLGSHTVAPVVLTDEQIIGVDQALLSVGGDVFSAVDVTLPTAGAYGSTITWAITTDAGSNATLDGNVLSLAMVFADAEVVVTATLTIGDTTVLTATSEFTFNLVGMTAEERVAADAADLDALGLSEDLYAGAVIELPTATENGSTITWAITDDAGSNGALDGSTLTLTIPATEATVTVTATVAMDTASQTVTVTYTLKNYPMVDLGDFSTQTTGDTVVITGNVYAVTKNGFFIEDTTGKLFVSTYNATYVVGDEVKVTGEVSYNYSSYYLFATELGAVISSGNDVAQTAIVYEDGVTELVSGNTYTVVGTVALEGTYSNSYIYYNETDSFYVFYQSPDDSIAALEAAVGTKIAVNLIYYNDGDTFFYVEGVAGVYTVYTDLAAVNEYDGSAWVIPDATDVYVQAIVAGIGYSGVYLQDANGLGLYMYYPDGKSSLNVGDEVIYFGELDDYPGNRQFASGADFIALVSTGNAVTPNVLTADEIIALAATDSTMLIQTNGLVYKGVVSGKLNFQVVGTTETIILEMYSEDATAWLGDIYNVDDVISGDVTFFYQKTAGANLRIELLDVPMSDTQAQLADKALIPTTLTLSADWSLPTPLYGSTFAITSITGDTGSTISWTSPSETLVVTQPEGADATGITVTVTVSFTGLADLTVDIDVTVSMVAAAATPDLFISEYAEGSSYNKYIEIYNPTASAIDLSTYSVALYGNGSATATGTVVLSTLQATIAAGEVIVIANSGAAQTILDAADYTNNTIINFNGDDAIAILKDGVVIDVVGYIGEATSFGANVTLVRNSSVVGPTDAYDTNEWTSFASDTWTDIGIYTTA